MRLLEFVVVGKGILAVISGYLGQITITTKFQTSGQIDQEHEK